MVPGMPLHVRLVRQQASIIWHSETCRLSIRPPQCPHSTRGRHYSQNKSSDPHKASFGSRLQTALAATKIRWTHIPLGVGIAFLGGFQIYRVRKRRHAEKQRELALGESDDERQELDQEGRPRKRPRIRPSGPWYAKQMQCDFVC